MRVFGWSVFVLVAATPLRADPPEAPEPSFDQRVRAQAAIERVYWAHRVWPGENRSPRPPFDVSFSRARLEERVRDTLGKSAALESLWGRPVTPRDLQAELDRMARDTRDGAVLRELFAALGNDPALIAETLARQSFVERLVRDLYAFDARFHDGLRREAEERTGGSYSETTWRLGTGASPSSASLVYLDPAEWPEHVEGLGTLPLGRPAALQESLDAFFVTDVLARAPEEVTTGTRIWAKVPFDRWWAAQRDRFSSAPGSSHPGTFSLPEISEVPCTPDTWTSVSTGGTVPAARQNPSAVWTGTEMIVWGGHDASGHKSTGGRFIPALDLWLPTSTGINVPAARSNHSAIWTGDEMIVWGGRNGSTYMNTGGRYVPATDSWTPTSTAAGVPQPRGFHTAVWTGSRMVVWGGGVTLSFTNTGARYDPAGDTWAPTSVGPGVPEPRVGHGAVWTGTEMIVWGGSDETHAPRTGGRYEPGSDTWQPTSTTGAPTGRMYQTAVWSGDAMIVWGGLDENVHGLQTGGRYWPATDSWSPTSTWSDVPSGRQRHTAVWTGSEMVVWGGSGESWTPTGGRYDPTIDAWVPTSTAAPVPQARESHVAVWTGKEMLVWAGRDLSEALNSLGRYCLGACVSPDSYFQDLDGDRFGDPSVWVQACLPPDGYVTDGSDCDDAEVYTYPGAAETKDGRDNQCSGSGWGVIDEITGQTGWVGVSFHWEEQAGATAYEVVRSAAPTFATACAAIAAVSVPAVDDPGVPPPGSVFFYLVRSVAPPPPGSWGQHSSGVERTGGCLPE